MMAVGKALMHVRITPMLWLSIFLFLSGQPQTGHSQYSGPPEVVIPLRITGTLRGMSPPGWVSYSLHFGSQRHIVHMKTKKLLVSRHLPVFTYTDQGVLLEDRPFVPDDCYYHGYVEGDPRSLVVLSTCSGGFDGTLQIKDIAYEIKPKKHSVTFEHLVYKMATEENQSPVLKCGLSDREVAQQLTLQEIDIPILEQSGYLDWWIHSWKLDMVFVVDHQRYVFRQNNNTRVIKEVIEVVNVVNSYLNALSIDLIIVGLEIWDNQDLVTISDDMPSVLTHFCNWRVSDLNHRIRNDLAHLLSHQFYARGYLGLAFVGSVCSHHYGCGVDRVLSRSVSATSHTVAHEIGHNLGMHHDEQVGPCRCGQSKCIMAAQENSSTKFSNCSYSYMWTAGITKSCLRNKLKPANLLPVVSCGNNVVEEGEECDCGPLASCGNDSCCTTNCTLKSSAECAFGLCCQSCNFRPPGTLCREKKGECDLPEWCNGTSHECPQDVYVLDGMSCAESGHCYENKCVNFSRDEQCRQIFGSKARSANETCYMEMNTQGNRFGNCGNNSQSYIRCQNKDILCGRIQCENVTEIPSLSEHTTVHCSQIRGSICWGTDYHFGIPVPDIGDVKDGTQCGERNMCIHRKCVTMPLWSSVCSREACNMSGICNNRNHCHCDFGWGPPNCTTEGYGGSVDSGPPPIPLPTTTPPPLPPSTSPPPVPSPTSPTSIYLFFLLLLLLLLLILLYFLWKKKPMEIPETIITEQPSAPPPDASVPPPPPQ